MNNNNWAPFWFETNQVWGECDTKSKWLDIKAVYIEYHGSIDYSRLRLNMFIKKSSTGKFYATLPSDQQERMPDFGHRREHRGDYTLEQFAKDNGMEL